MASFDHDGSSSYGLIANLADIEVVGALESMDRKFSVIVYVDEKEEWKSKPVQNATCQVNHRLPFRPSSVIKIDIVRSSRNPFKNKIVLGRRESRITELLENDNAIDLADENGTATGSRIKIKLSLITTEDVMRSVDAAIALIDDNTVVAKVSGYIDTGSSMAQTAYGALNTFGTYIAPLGQALALTAKIMDNIADAHPILKVSWIVLSSVHKAVQQQELQDADVRDLAESLREMVGVANECQDLLVIKGTTNVIECIGRALLEVAALIDEYTKLPLLGRTLKYQLSDDMKTRIQQCRKYCDDLIKKFDRRVAVSTNKKVTKSDSNKQQDEIFRWLSAIVPYSNYHAALTLRHGDTGSWFIKGTQFEEWKAKAGSFLWVNGKPGCGKTVLSSSIIEIMEHHCKDDASRAYAYFFFDARDSQSELQKHENLIRSLIRQFSAQRDAVPSALTNLHGRCGSGDWQPSIADLHSTLLLILNGFQHAYIIIDSIDECMEREELLNWIENITTSKAHLLTTSRTKPDIAERLGSLGHGHLCMNEFVNQDIQKYLDHKFQTNRELKMWDKETQNNIKGTLTKSADGMFQLVALQLKALQTCRDRYELATKMKLVPEGLDNTYVRIIQQVKKGDFNNALKILQWLAFSVRPLSLDEIAQVVGVVEDPERGICFKPDRLYPSSQLVLTVCSDFVTPAEGEVRLSHLTVKEYLLSERHGSVDSSFSISEKGSHSLISQTCLAYLLQFTSIDALNENTIQNFPLARYAAEYWTYHARAGSGDNSDALQKLTMNLLRTPALVACMRLYDPDHPRRFPHLSKPSNEVACPLYYASLAGLLPAVQALVEQPVDINAQGGYYGNALQAASYGGHEMIVKVLLETGADVNAQGGHYGNALQAASYQGHEVIVKLLLEKRADVNAQGGDFGNALQAASTEGREAIVKLLLEEGADINTQRGHYGSALQAASYRGQEAIVKLLLEKEADVEVQGGVFGNALQAASTEGREAIVKLLLKKRANVNAQAGYYGNALQAASYRGREAIVKLLLEEGADVNAQGGDSGNALHAASCQGHKVIVQLLLGRRADVNAQGGYYGNALQAASYGGQQAIVKLLLEKEADVNAQGGFYGCALQAASYGGHEVIVKLLLGESVDVNTQGGQYGNALQAASYGGHEVIVKLLLEKKADVNAQGGQYGNALQAASSEGHKVIVQQLLDYGAIRKEFISE